MIIRGVKNSQFQFGYLMFDGLGRTTSVASNIVFETADSRMEPQTQYSTSRRQLSAGARRIRAEQQPAEQKRALDLTADRNYVPSQSPAIEINVLAVLKWLLVKYWRGIWLFLSVLIWVIIMILVFHYNNGVLPNNYTQAWTTMTFQASWLYGWLCLKYISNYKINNKHVVQTFTFPSWWIPNDFDNPLSCPRTPHWHWHLWFRVKYPNNYVMDWREIWMKHSCSP